MAANTCIYKLSLPDDRIEKPEPTTCLIIPEFLFAASNSLKYWQLRRLPEAGLISRYGHLG
jgi:hypothetical protein